MRSNGPDHYRNTTIYPPSKEIPVIDFLKSLDGYSVVEESHPLIQSENDVVLIPDEDKDTAIRVVINPAEGNATTSVVKPQDDLSEAPPMALDAVVRLANAVDKQGGSSEVLASINDRRTGGETSE